MSEGGTGGKSAMCEKREIIELKIAGALIEPRHTVFAHRASPAFPAYLAHQEV
jgi:hypothetical protein